MGINQVIWDPATKTLVFQCDQLLQQHSRYLLIVTDGVRDTDGKNIKSDGLTTTIFGGSRATWRIPARSARCHARAPWQPDKIVAASLFTTQSATTDLAKIMRQIKRSTPAPVDFMVGTTAGGPVRALFPLAALTASSSTARPARRRASRTSFLPTPALGIVPGAVGQIAYGLFSSPDYETAAKFIPATGTLTGQPQPQGTNELVFQLFLPAGAKPANGWPVAIFGHGFGDSMYGAPWTVASMLASQGIATLSINVVGHGGGALGTLNVLRPAPRRWSYRRRPRHRPGRQRRHRLHRRQQRRAAAHRHQQSRRPAPDGGRPDAAGARRSRWASTSTATARRPGRAAHLLRRPVFRRHLRHHPPGHRADIKAGVPNVAGRLDHRDRAA